MRIMNYLRIPRTKASDAEHWCFLWSATEETVNSLLNRLLRRRSKKTSKLIVTGLCDGNSPGTSEFPAQMASNAENVSIWWRHHAGTLLLHQKITHDVHVYFIPHFNGHVLIYPCCKCGTWDHSSPLLRCPMNFMVSQIVVVVVSLFPTEIHNNNKWYIYA